MEPIIKMSARDLVAEKLREEIYTKRLAPGEELIQEKISEQLGVSRMPVREALLLLENAGLIEIQKNKRAVVKEISIESSSEYLEIRTLLECQAAVKACRNATDFSSLEKLQKRIIAQASEMDQSKFRKLNTQFHYELWTLAQSPNLERLLKQIWYTAPSPYPSDVSANIQRNIREHGAILEALVEHNEQKAISAVSFHINKTRDIVVDVLQAVKNA